jgi:hypothetical protein
MKKITETIIKTTVQLLRMQIKLKKYILLNTLIERFTLAEMQELHRTHGEQLFTYEQLVKLKLKVKAMELFKEGFYAVEVIAKMRALCINSEIKVSDGAVYDYFEEFELLNP